MSKQLSREQVEGYLTDLVQDKVDGVRVAQLLDTDAALRAINFDHEIGFHAAEEEITRLQAENERLKQQLAAMTQERDGLKEDLDAAWRETWVKVAKSFDKKFLATDKRLDNTRDYRVDEFYAWCRAQAAHGGPHDDPR